MEESAQRRERLKALRIEASQEAAAEHSTIISHGSTLSNPLVENSETNQGGQLGSFAQGFNYYTDPMSAFSGNKQRSKVSPQLSQDFSTPPRSWTNKTLPSPDLQPQMNFSHDQRMHQPQGQYTNNNFPFPSNAPRGGNLPSPSFGGGSFPGHSFECQGGRSGFPHLNNSPRPGFGQESYPGSGRGGYSSPRPQFSNPFRGSVQDGYSSPRPHSGNSPGRGSGQGGYPSPGPYFSSSSGRGPVGGSYHSPGPQFSNSTNRGSGTGGFSSPAQNQGRGHWSGHSMSSGPSPGRGRGRWSPHGGGTGRGRGDAHNHVSAEDRPDLFYNKSMVEDPWMFLEPVIWKSHKKPWLSNSLSMKKAKVSESPRHQQSSSQPSLAEYLAASFNEAANEEPSS